MLLVLLFKCRMVSQRIWLINTGLNIVRHSDVSESGKDEILLQRRCFESKVQKKTCERVFRHGKGE
jgi:hypothetical protein